MRALFSVLALGTVAAFAVRLLLHASGGPAPHLPPVPAVPLALALLTLGWLAGHVVRQFWAGASTGWADGGALLALGVHVALAPGPREGVPLDGVPLLYALLDVWALQGRARRTAVRTVLGGAVLLGAAAVHARLSGQPAVPLLAPQMLGHLLGLACTAFTLHVLARTLPLHDEAAARERALRAAAGLLSEASSRETVEAAALAAAEALLAPSRVHCVGLLRPMPAGGFLAVALQKPPHTEPPAEGRGADSDGPQGGGTLLECGRLEVDGLVRGPAPMRLAGLARRAFGLPPRGPPLHLFPLDTAGEAQGALVVEGLLASDARAAAETLAANVALALRALEHSEARFRSLVQHASDLILVVDAGGALRYASPSLERLLGHLPEHLEGVPLSVLLEPAAAEEAQGLLARAAQGAPLPPRTSWRLRHRDGTWCDVELLCTNLLGDPHVRGLVLNGRDVRERTRLEQQLTHLAYHDPLTGLGNRALFRKCVETALGRAPAAAPPPAVLYLDLDDFKAVNDRLGHAAGDQLLFTVAERMRRALRSTDLAARLGGDEFAVLLEGLSADEVAGVAARLLQSVQAPLTLEGREVRVGASVGVAVASPGTSVDGLLRQADGAMYAAKGGGKGRLSLASG
jgi:diguanylate cyclase (GGDEF)-like protein/PAS domain S-box-containing protein